MDRFDPLDSPTAARPAPAGGRGAATEARFPDEPWKWRDDWAQGFARDGSRDAFGGMLVFALLWNLVALPAGVIGWQKGVVGGERAGLIALLFPLAGAWLLFVAAREGLRRARFAASRLDLDAVPVPIGRSLTGTLRTPLTEPPPGGLVLVLSCTRTDRSGSDDSWTRVLWQDEATVQGRLGACAPSAPGDRTPAGPVVVAPVAFRVPAEAPGTDARDSAHKVTWTLEAQAREPGVDYRARFELPVYRTEASDRPETAADAMHLRPTLAGPSFAVTEAAALAGAPRPLPASPIAVREEGGALVVDFPPARNRGAALSLVVISMIWTGVLAVLQSVRAPVIFPVMWALFDALLWCGVAWLWLWTTRVRIDARGVSVAGGLGAPGKERLVPREQIADVRLAVGMTVGTTAYYDLRVATKNGRTVGAGGSIRHKAEAEWIAAKMMAALGTS